MANGETLDDEKLTLAMTPAEVREHKLLNKTVTVRNTKTGSIAKARVTDTGGFGKYNRVADLSLATKQAINCTDLCHVEVTAD
jgi:rare lipoprotein A (peptidoglycan hydrolase)